MGYRYIGSKARIAEEILHYIGKPEKNSGFFVDAFSGTGAVAEEAANFGWRVRVNDMLESSIIVTESRLLSEADISFSFVGGYAKAIEYLNSQPGSEGVMWKEYSPASVSFCEFERRYFTESNAKKIDGAIQTVNNWKNSNLVSLKEYRLLLADIIKASNKVANIAGTYGCFLSKWSKQAMAEFTLTCSKLRCKPIDYECSVKDVFEVKTEQKDLVYLDPPYTKRQYASYYHIPETIVSNDHPVVNGVSGLRPWKEKSSVFCYKSKALSALTRLILQQDAHRVILSYSNEGHVRLSELVDQLGANGDVKLIELGEIARYTPNKTALDNRKYVGEYLIDFTKRVDC